jgi:hypothetical protein
MWIFTKFGFLSVVEDRDQADRLVIRARFQEDVEALCRRIAGATGQDKVVWQQTGDADYPYGVTCGRETMAAIVEQLVREIDYTQFSTGKTIA